MSSRRRVTVVAIPLREVGNYNTGNVYALTPFNGTEDELLVTSSQLHIWRDSWMLQELARRFKKITPVPDAQWDLITAAPECRKIVLDVLRQFYDPRHWWTFKRPPALRIPLSTEEIDMLLKHYTFQLSSTQPMVDALAEKIDALMARSGAEPRWFVKVNTTSPKRSMTIQPVVNGKDVLHTLMCSNDIRQDMTHGLVNAILLCAWNEHITPDNEFRVFVRDNRVMGVSQQMIYGVYTMMHQWAQLADEIVEAFQRLWDSFVFSEGIIYRECTFDGYIASGSNENLEAELIEINTGAFGWGPAGSSLFEWETCPPPKEGAAEFRYTVF